MGGVERLTVILDNLVRQLRIHSCFPSFLKIFMTLQLARQVRAKSTANLRSLALAHMVVAPTRRVAHGNMGYVKAKLGKIEESEVQFCE